MSMRNTDTAPRADQYAQTQRQVLVLSDAILTTVVYDNAYFLFSRR